MITMARALLHGFLPLGFYLATIAVFLISALWRPQVGMYFLAFFLPLENARYWLHAFPYGEKFVDVVLLGILIGIMARRNGASWVPTPLTTIILAWGVLLYASLCMGSFYLNTEIPLSVSDPRVSDWKNYIELPIFFLAAAGAIRSKKQMTILLATMGVCFLLIGNSFHNTMSGRDLTNFSYEVRTSGPMGGAGENGLATFEATCLLFMVSLLGFKLHRYVKLAIYVLLPVGMYCLLFTFSRGAYLCFLVGLAFLAIVRQRKLLILVAVILISWQTLLPAAVQQRIMMTYDDTEGAQKLDPSAQTRVDLWQDAEQLIREYPILGTGFQTYYYMHRVGIFNDTHNYYLKIMLETGLVGLLFFFFVVWRMFALGYELYRRAPDPFLSAIGLGFAALMVGMVFANIFGDRWSYFTVDGWMWILLGVVARGLLLVEQQAKAADRVTSEEQAMVPAFAGIRSGT